MRDRVVQEIGSSSRAAVTKSNFACAGRNLLVPYPVRGTFYLQDTGLPTRHEVPVLVAYNCATSESPTRYQVLQVSGVNVLAPLMRSTCWHTYVLYERTG